MASRTIIRRLVHVSRRIPVHSHAAVQRITMMRHLLQQNEAKLQGSSYRQIRSLCSKPGDGMIINIQDEEDFEKRVVNSDKPVVVDFHARCELVLNDNPRIYSTHIILFIKACVFLTLVVSYAL